MSGNGDRFVVVPLSEEYGERRYAIDDLSLSRHNLVRQWRSRGVGKTSVAGVKKPKTGMVWRGTEAEANHLCAMMNKSAQLGSMSVASDPPIRENAVAQARSRARSTPSRRTTAKAHASFAPCPTCKKIVRQPHGEH